MNQQRMNKPALSQGEKENSCFSEFKIVAEAFLELFELLEDYAPAWYTQQHHSRALAAHRILQRSKRAAGR